jgi:hypothetical protein
VLHHCFGSQLASGALSFAQADEETKSQCRNLVQQQEQAKRDALRIAIDKHVTTCNSGTLHSLAGTERLTRSLSADGEMPMRQSS